ncbi:phage tail protein [Pantoea wallisii]
MMLKPQHLQQALTDGIPWLQQHPEQLSVTTGSGQIVATLATSLSFEYRYALNVTLSGYSDDLNLVMVPLLAWLRRHQPDLMMNDARSGITFATDAANTLRITLQLSERVIVSGEGDALHVAYADENPLAANVDRPLQLYAHGDLISSFPS